LLSEEGPGRTVFADEPSPWLNGRRQKICSRARPNGCRSNRTRNAWKKERISREGCRNLRQDV